MVASEACYWSLDVDTFVFNSFEFYKNKVWNQLICESFENWCTSCCMTEWIKLEKKYWNYLKKQKLRISGKYVELPDAYCGVES